MLTIQFLCPLPNGLHARPAWELKEQCSQWQSEITFINHRQNAKADAKSSLALIGTGTLFNDSCSLNMLMTIPFRFGLSILIIREDSGKKCQKWREAQGRFRRFRGLCSEKPDFAGRVWRNLDFSSGALDGDALFVVS